MILKTIGTIPSPIGEQTIDGGVVPRRILHEREGMCPGSRAVQAGNHSDPGGTMPRTIDAHRLVSRTDVGRDERMDL